MMNARMELSYNILITWFVLHYSMQMQRPKEAGPPFVQRLVELNWFHDYLYNIRKVLMNPQAFEVFCCHPFIPDAPFGDEYEDVSFADDERLIALSYGLFL